MNSSTPALPLKFYRRSAATVAEALLGQLLICRSDKGVSGGLIVETEAYLGECDPASHAFHGISPRNAVMFGPAGRAYIYFTYGMHYCFNVVTATTGVAEAVLIRSLEPTYGIEIMQQRRKQMNLSQLCSGPAKLVQALGISKDLTGHKVTQTPLQIILQAEPIDSIEIGSRIGISQGMELPLRFYLKNNPFVSKPKLRPTIPKPNKGISIV